MYIYIDRRNKEWITSATVTIKHTSLNSVRIILFPLSSIFKAPYYKGYYDTKYVLLYIVM
jgi:hypothetical protein